MNNFEYVIAGNKYGKYCVPVSSAKTSPPAKKAIAGEVYEPKTIDFIMEQCGDGDIIHAGAYFGDFLPALSKALVPGATVWTFEPKEEHCICAAGTISLNKLDNVALQHAGLGNRDNCGAILTTVKADGTTWGGGSRIEDDIPEGVTTEEIDIVAIDDTVPASRNVSIIHLDIEGFEQQALEGARETIERCRPTIIVETCPKKGWLVEMRYTLSPRKLHRNFVLVPN